MLFARSPFPSHTHAPSQSFWQIAWALLLLHLPRDSSQELPKHGWRPICRRWFSAHRQDRFLYDHIYAYLPSPKRGGLPRIYVEAGAHDGLNHSNTAALEQCFGWRGLLVEPSPVTYPRVRASRPRSWKRNLCLSESSGSTTLYVSFDVPEISTTRHDTDNPLGRCSTCDPQPAHVRCETLGVLLAELGIANVDYLSLDVEGSELDALRGIDWTVKITFLSVETMTRPDSSEEHASNVEAYLRDRNYRFISRKAFDDIYRHNEDLECRGAIPELNVTWVSLQKASASLAHHFTRRAAAGGDVIPRACQLVVAITHTLTPAAGEELCSPGMLAARLAATFCQSTLEIVASVVDHSMLLSAKQVEHFGREYERNPDADTTSLWWPLPVIWIAMDFMVAIQSGWPLPGLFAAVGMALRREPPAHPLNPGHKNMEMDGGRLAKRGCRVLRDDGAQMEAWNDMCLLCRTAPDQLAEALTNGIDVVGSGHAAHLVRGVEALVKRLAERRGLYWLLHAAAHPNCTIWQAWNLFAPKDAQMHFGRRALASP